MNKRLRYFIFNFVLLISSSGIAQDVQFSQLFTDRMYLNPAFAGVDYCPRFLISYRNQWPGIEFPYVTYQVSFDQYIESLHGGIGFRIMQDQQGGGVFNQLSADFIYAYQTRISDKVYLNFAFEASIYQKATNTRDLVFYNMIDPLQGVIYPGTENFDQEKFHSPDFSSGLLLRYENYSIGLSASHIPLNLVEMHNEYLPFKFTIHAGALIPMDRLDTKRVKIVFEPNVIFVRQQKMNMLYYGTYFDINEMSFGLFIRQNFKFHFDDLIASYHIRINKLSIGYSYDVTLSKFIKQTLGAHELSLVYLIPCDKKIRKYNTISCPSF